LARESGAKTACTVVGAAGQKRAVGPHPLFPFAQVLMTDRVSERRRAAQLARHYRDQEGLAIAEIGRRLGRAQGTVKAYLYDPVGERRARSRRATGARAVAAARRQARGAARETRTNTAKAAVPGRSRGNGPASGAVRRCAPGERATALPRPPTTGRAPTRRRSAQTTTSRRMARAVHRDRSVPELGSGPRRRLRRRLNVRVSMPLTYERALALGRL
jgi:hypothetical protein